jgi:hypothetical protein
VKPWPAPIISIPPAIPPAAIPKLKSANAKVMTSQSLK